MGLVDNKHTENNKQKNIIVNYRPTRWSKCKYDGEKCSYQFYNIDKTLHALWLVKNPFYNIARALVLSNSYCAITNK